VGGSTSEIVAVLVTDPRVAEIVADPEKSGNTPKRKVALTDPAGMVTDSGTIKAGLLDTTARVDGFEEGALNVMEHAPLGPA
jgi:hypothetical protein